MSDRYPQFDWAGVIFGFVFAALWFAGAYWLWPDGVTDKPLASITLGELFKVLAAIFFCLLGLAAIGVAIKDANEPFQ